MTTALQEVPRNFPTQHFLGPLDEPGFTFTPTGLIIDPSVTFEEWERYGRKLQLAEKGIQWALGDWVIHGETHFKERAAQAVDFTGRKIKTLQNYATVAGAVKQSRRRDSDVVDFSTHAEVASLPDEEQERILAIAEADPGEMTVQKVRREVHKVKRKMGKQKSEIEILQTPEVKDWLATLHSSVVPYEENCPQSARFLRSMVRSFLGVIEEQSERTVESDCSKILSMFEGDKETAPYSATDDEIFKWLIGHFYFISDPELDERLESMAYHSIHEGRDDAREKEAKEKNKPVSTREICRCEPENKRLKYVQTGGRKEGQSGGMTWVYMPYASKIFG